MIRLVGKKLIIPRGDTGSFSVPLVTTFNPSDMAIFSILDEKTQKVIQRIECIISEEALTVNFTHYNTVNLPIGKYYWDIKSYKNPEIVDGELVNGTEVDSYYAAYSLPVCEIRQTGDKLLNAEDDEPSILNQQDFNLLNAALNEAREANTALQQYKGEVEDMLHQEQRLETVETNLQELTTNLQSLENELQQHTIEADETLNQRLGVLGNTLQELETNLQSLSNTLQQHISEANNLFNQSEQLETVENTVDSIETNIENINSEIQTLTTALNSLKQPPKNIKDGTGTGAIIEGLLEQKYDIETDEYNNANIATGNYSHAEGFSTSATGNFAHTEGSFTRSNGICSHAEGIGTRSTGEYSHAEGQLTQSQNQASHAQGQGTIASGGGSHAEGIDTVSSGGASHAEGKNSTSSGTYSHVEGYNTIAKHRSQHVFGEYNIADPSSAIVTAKGTYVEIVGNGTELNSRSNARTLDWSGNETLSGSITLGKGTADEVTITAAQLKQLLTLLQ